MNLVHSGKHFARNDVGATVIKHRIPLEGPWERLRALGFIPDDVIEGDGLFRFAALPEGWRAENPDEDGVTFLTDGRGFRRVGIVDREVDGRRSVYFAMLNVGYDLAILLVAFEGQLAPALPAQWSVLDKDERVEFFRGVQDLSREHKGKWRRAQMLGALAQDDEDVTAWAERTSL